MTQRELARISGVSRDTISALETGVRVPSYRTLVRLAATLGVGVDSLVDLNGMRRCDDWRPPWWRASGR